jgi:hypothetical protein
VFFFLPSPPPTVPFDSYHPKTPLPHSRSRERSLSATQLALIVMLRILTVYPGLDDTTSPRDSSGSAPGSPNFGPSRGFVFLAATRIRSTANAARTANEKTHTAWVSGRGGNNVQAKESHIISTETQCVWDSLCYTLHR